MNSREIRRNHMITSPPLQLLHLLRRNQHVSVLVQVLEGLEGLQLLGHLLQADLQTSSRELCFLVYISEQ